MSLLFSEVKKIIDEAFFKRILLALLVVNAICMCLSISQKEDVYDNSEAYVAYQVQIAENYETIKQVSIFSNAQSFSYKNNEKLHNDYEKVKDVVVEKGSSIAVENVLASDVTDIIVLFLVLYTALKMIFIEKDTGMQLVIMPTVNGRDRLIASKLTGVACLVIGLTLLFYGSNYIIAVGVGDFGNLDRSIQSVAGYEQCCYRLSVAQAMGIAFLSKIAVYMMIACGTVMLAILFDKVAFVYVTWIFVFTLEFVGKLFIPGYSIYYVLSQVNLLTFLNADTYFSAYSNINFFGTPVSNPWAFFVVIPLLIIVFIVIAVQMFCAQENDLQEKSIHIPMFQKKREHITNHLFSQELYKVLIYNKGFFIILLMAICTYIFLPAKVDNVGGDVEIFYRNYLRQIEGEATPEKMQYLNDVLVEIQQYYEGAMKEEDMKLVISPDADSFFYQEEALNMLLQKGEYLLEKQGYFIVEDGFIIATGGSLLNEKPAVLLLLLMSVILIVANVWCMEYDSGMDTLLCACPNGGKVLNGMKYKVIYLVVLFTKVISDFIYYENIFSAYGLRGIHAPACSLKHLSMIPSQISIFMFLIILVICEFLVLIIYSTILIVLQKKWRSYMNTILGAILIAIVVVFLF